MARPRDDAAGAVRTGRVRRRGWQTVTPGVHVADDASAVEVLRGWATVLPPGAAFTGLTAAFVRRWWLPPLPRDVPVFAVQSRREPRPRRAGMVVSRSAVPPVTETWFGVPVTSTLETLLACARTVSLLDLVVLVDAALARSECTKPELEAFCTATAPSRGVGRRVPGLRALHDAVRLADERAESPWETLLRVLHVVCEIPVVPQHHLTLSGGAKVRADLWLVGTTVLHEYDGAHHRSIDGHRSDLRRDRRLLADGLTRRGYTSADLLRRPDQILKEADGALGRPHDPARLRPWLDLLAESLFTRQGTAACRSRWGLGQPSGVTSGKNSG